MSLLSLASFEPYEYHPIPQSSRTFRLLRILPPRKSVLPGFHGTPRIELFEAHVDSCILYDALSYTWDVPAGQTEPDRLVIVESKLGAREVRVFRQLELALRHLGSISTRPLFIDQICINQADTNEKQHQVQLMRDVYAKCSRTLIWLGEGTRASDQYYSYVEKVMNEGVISRVMGPRVGQFMNVFDAVVDSTRSVTESEKEDRDDILRLISLYGHEFPIKGITDVLERKWFNRLWVIQEACLAPNLLFVCGSKRLCYDCFRGGLLFFNLYNNHWLANSTLSVPRWELERRSHVQNLNAGLSRIIKDRKVIHGPGTRQSLYDVILKYNVNHESRKIGATLSEDRIFGLMGLTADDDVLRAEVTVDYHIGAAQVYTNTTAILMKHSIDVLLFNQLPKQIHDDHELPSWVPDWTMALKLPCGYVDLSWPVYSAGGPMDAQPIEYVEAHGQIKLRGILLDIVASVGQETLLASPEKDVTEQLDYISAKKFFDEAAGFVNEASQSRDHAVSPDENNYELQLLRLSDGELTLRQFTEDWGPEEAVRRLRDCYTTINKVGAALIRDKEFIASYHITRIIRSVGIVPWYAYPVSDWEIVKFMAKDPATAAKLFLCGTADFLVDIVGLCTASMAVSIMPWYLRLKKRFSLLELGQSEEATKSAFSRNGIESGSVTSRFIGIFCDNLLKHKGRRLYRTEKGYVGMGPGHMRVGDCVVVFPGSTVPHVIRALEQSGTVAQEIWSYIGEAYCDGVMDGQVINQSQQGLNAFTLA